MNQIQMINEQDVLGKNFRIYGDYENPLFLAKDVAEWIEHSDAPKMLLSIDEDEKLKRTLFVAGQNREVWFLTEDGLYEVLMQSRKPIAKEFKKRVKKILKGLRTGECHLIPHTYKEAIQHLLIEIEKNEQLESSNKMLAQINSELKPKADYFDTILKNKGLVTISQIAKDYGMSGRQFNAILHDLGVQYKQSGQWLLYSRYHSKGYTMSETVDIERSDGKHDVVMNTKWTQKGRIFLYELLKKNEIVPTIEKTTT